MDDNWGGAENIAMFDTMLKSILKPSSDLQKNWEVDLIKLCDTFLQKIRRAIQEGCSYVDFVEAAMVVQSSAAVYARKVDYLWVQLEKLLVTVRSNPAGGRRADEAGQGSEHADRDGEEGTRRVRRTACNLGTEDFSDVELSLPDSRSIDLKPSRGEDVEEFEEADYFIQDLMNNKETGSSMPLFDMHGDMIGNTHDFRMNRRLLDGMWLADSLPVFELKGHPSTSGCDSVQESMEVEELPVSTEDAVSCGAPTESTQQPVEERPPSPDQRPPTPLPPEEPPPQAPTPPPPSPGQGSEDMEITRAAMTRSATRSLNLVDVTMVSQEELIKSCKADIPDKPLVVHPCTRPECVYCGERHEKKGRRECCKSEQEIERCLSGIEAMLLDDVIKPELTKLGGFQFNKEFLLGLRKSQIRSIQEPACLSDWTSYTLDDVKLMFEDDEEEDFRGFDLSLHQEILQLAGMQVPRLTSDEEDAPDFEGVDVDQNEAEFPLSQGDVPLPVDVGFERDAINSCPVPSPPEFEFQYPTWQPDAADDVDEVEARTARVAAWHENLRPLLSGAEERSHVDIHEYGSRLLAAFPAGRARSTLSLQHILQGKPREDTCRYFLSALMLANTCNVEISKSDDSELAMDCVELTLLDRARRHELMEEECASITTSDRSRKRKKAMPAADQTAYQPLNGPVETPLRESPNRINIMSRGSAFRSRTALSHAGPSHRPAPGPSKCAGDPQPGPSWASDASDRASDASDSVDLSDVRTLGASKGKRRKV